MEEISQLSPAVITQFPRRRRFLKKTDCRAQYKTEWFNELKINDFILKWRNDWFYSDFRFFRRRNKRQDDVWMNISQRFYPVFEDSSRKNCLQKDKIFLGKFIESCLFNCFLEMIYNFLFVTEFKKHLSVPQSFIVLKALRVKLNLINLIKKVKALKTFNISYLQRLPENLLIGILDLWDFH